MDNKIKLKGHESFSLREGWLTKGIFEVKDNPNVFSCKNLTDIFGIGTNMVKSLKYWLQATGMIQEEKKSEYKLTKLGELIYEYDPYLEDIFSLYFIHLNLVTNTDKAIIWNIFFNLGNLKNFTKKELLDQLKYVLDSRNLEYNEKILVDEISTLLKTYVNEENNDTPENNFTCPLTDLKLIKKVNKDVFQKELSTLDNLNMYVVLYCIYNQMESDSISFEKLYSGENSVGKLLNLDKVILNEYIDMLKREEYLIVNRTAGLNMIYINKKIELEDMFKKYYRRDS